MGEINFLFDDLSFPSMKKRDKVPFYMGVCKMKGFALFRHIDIKVYKPQHFAFAILYFTGSDHFNRSMRFFAKKKGLTLSDTHLAPALRSNGSKLHTFMDKAIVCKTEEQIFAALGLTYIAPTDRNTFENFGPALDAKDTMSNDNDDSLDCPSGTP